MGGITFILLLFGIGILSGIVSAAAGLASLVSYPSLLALGLPPVMANVTSAFSTVTGNYSSVFASFKELKNNRRQLWLILPLVFAGSIIGAFLLFAVPGKLFAELVPLCIALAGIILLFPHHPKKAAPTMGANSKLFGKSRISQFFSIIGIFIVGIYSGFFNAGAGVLMLTLLTVINSQKSFAVNNALKNVAMTVTNTTSWIVFAIETTIYWNYVIPLMIGNVVGGYVGPIIVRHLPGRLMQVIVGIGALILAGSLVIRNLM
ncbi:sulfite exporter TauE/SafE family protein [Limosilactobacillus walteri]|uniref:Probable membrane transporter protein n=1 Tax=Limosilactobacillus walteri TaxID=2268022 RepID=A0ABR8P5B8_9LACO|nr:sulfite exporter TauE/SafE family protein [Limosilactobacillus walteri]MBD5805764.1 sulfite exporter TauE/SafE family protein [Limosilactobacillus walteri]